VQGSCDAAKAVKKDGLEAELRCVGGGPTERLPAGSLVCEAQSGSALQELGVPMTAASVRLPPRRPGTAPTGRNLALGAPGLIVEVSQGASDVRAAIALRAGAVILTEADYAPAEPTRSPTAPR
jgi:hypothetical protein